MAAWWITLPVFCLFSVDSDAGNHMHTLHCQPQLRCYIPLMLPHAFTSFTLLSICSTFPFHPSFSSFSPERLVCEWAHCVFYRHLAAARGQRAAEMPQCLYILPVRRCERIEKTFNHLCEKKWDTVEDGWMGTDKGDEEEEDESLFCNWLS